MDKTLTIVLILLLICVSITACEVKSTKNATNDSATISEVSKKSTDESTLNEQTYEIKTKYCTLEYPAIWEDAVTIKTTSEDPYTLRFTGTVDNKILPLFDLAFDTTDGILLGTLHIDENHTLSLIPYEINEKECSSDQYKLFCGMQEDVNIIINHLKTNYDFET